MRYKENVILEIQKLLNMEFHIYKQEIPHMNNDEWNQLYEWLPSGIVLTLVEMVYWETMVSQWTSYIP